MQKTNPKSYKQDQEGRVEHYADMKIYTVDQARLVPKMCPHKLPTTLVKSLTLSNV